MSGYHDDPHPPGYVDVGGSSFGSPADSWRNQSQRPTQRPSTTDERGTAMSTSIDHACEDCGTGLELDESKTAGLCDDCRGARQAAPASHTPGPWATSADAVPDGYTQVTVYSESSGERVATAFGCEANARLIAAAPELLDALIRLVAGAQRADVNFSGYECDYYDGLTGDAVDEAIAAITKAVQS